MLRSSVVRRAALLVSLLASLALLGASSAAEPGSTFLVTLATGAAAADTGALFQSAGVHTLETLSPLAAVRVQAAPDADLPATLAALRASPLVRSADLEGEQHVQVVPSDRLYRTFQWNLKRIGMEQAWDLRPTAEDVIVAVLDTGVDLTHPDLKPNLLTSAAYNFVDDNADVQDNESHGTAVAGIVGAVGNNGEGVAGINWRVKILPIKTLNDRGRGPDAALVKGILYAADQGAKVINVSSTGTRASQALADAVTYAQGKGALVVAAAGNSGDQQNETTYPAALDGVLAVTAVDDHDQVAPFAQRGPYVNLAAPGVDVASTNWSPNGREPYASQSGTSIAAPHVSGVAALLFALRPDLSAADIANTLLSTADDIGPPGPDEASGAGVVNAQRAVSALRLGVPPRDTGTVVSRPMTAAGAPVPLPPPLPAESRRWYFAEGSTRPPFDLWFAIQNPGTQPATARFTFLGTDGTQSVYERRVEAGARATVHASEVHPNAEFSTVVQSDLPLYVERSMYFGHDGHTSPGAREPARTWYLAEGSTVPPFDTWLLIANPGPTPANARITFMREDGTTVDRLEQVPPTGRKSVYVNPVLPNTAGFATQVTADQPVVVERAMYFDAGQGGHDTLAASALARAWYFAAGQSRPGTDTWLLVENPGSVPANTTVSFMTDTGAVATQPLLVKPRGRASLYANLVVPNGAYGIKLDSDQPVVAERAVYVDSGRAGFDSVGVPAPASEWFLPEGSTTSSFEEQLSILNPQSQPANVQVDFRREDGTAVPSQRFAVSPTARLTLDVNAYVVDSNVALRVLSDRPVVVERASYFARPGGQGATNSTGLTR